MTNEQLQRKIAEVLGWTNLNNFGPNSAKLPMGHPPGKNYASYLPDWPNDRNASKDLPVEDKNFYDDAISIYLGGSKDSLVQARPLDAMTECLIWLLYMGWRWEECEECEGGRAMEKDLEHAGLECVVCDGEKGRWVKCRNRE